MGRNIPEEALVGTATTAARDKIIDLKIFFIMILYVDICYFSLRP
jgi:hypothetical protein